MAKLVVEISVGRVPGSDSIDIGIGYVEHAGRLSDGKRRKKLIHSVAITGWIGACQMHAVAQFFDSGARSEVGQVGLTIAAIQAGIAIAGKHHGQSDGRDQD